MDENEVESFSLPRKIVEGCRSSVFMCGGENLGGQPCVKLSGAGLTYIAAAVQAPSGPTIPETKPVKSLAETLVMKILYRAEEVTCLMLKPFGELLNNRASSSYHVKRLQELHSCVHAVSAYCIPAGPYLMPIHCVKLYIGRLSIKH